MKTTIHLPYVAWREGRPRFVPGARERAMGFKGKDLRHADGRWFTVIEAQRFAADQQASIRSMRQHAPLTMPLPAIGDGGYVYFLRCGDWLKVGYSKQPNRRVRELATRSPYRITSWASVAGTRHDEAWVHTALASHRINGEWFAYGPEAARVMLRSLTFGRVMTDENENMSQASAS